MSYEACETWKEFLSEWRPDDLKSLTEIRDEKAEDYGVHIVDNMHSLGTYKKADFKAGFDAAIDAMAEELKFRDERIAKLRAALEFVKDEDELLHSENAAIETIWDVVAEALKADNEVMK